MSNRYVGGLDDIKVDVPDILEPEIGFNIRNPIELMFEESLPASYINMLQAILNKDRQSTLENY